MVNWIKGLLDVRSHQENRCILNVGVLDQSRCKSYWFSYNMAWYISCLVASIKTWDHFFDKGG